MQSLLRGHKHAAPLETFSAEVIDIGPLVMVILSAFAADVAIGVTPRSSIVIAGRASGAPGRKFGWGSAVVLRDTMRSPIARVHMATIGRFSLLRHG